MLETPHFGWMSIRLSPARGWISPREATLS
jgi:hypothetical protein